MILFDIIIYTFVKIAKPLLTKKSNLNVADFEHSNILVSQAKGITD